MIIPYLDYIQLASVICIVYIIPVLIQQRFTHFNRFSLTLMKMTSIWVIFNIALLLKVPIFVIVAVFVIGFETLFLYLFGGLYTPSFHVLFEVRAFILCTFGMILYHYMELVKSCECQWNPAIILSKSRFAYLERI